MQTKPFFSVLSTLAFAQAQVAAPAPSPSTLTTTQSGVLPIAPTPFPGLETIEGAITYDGPTVDGFTGTFRTFEHYLFASTDRWCFKDLEGMQPFKMATQWQSIKPSSQAQTLTMLRDPQLQVQSAVQQATMELVSFSLLTSLAFHQSPNTDRLVT